MRSSKSRSRSKPNRPRSLGNIINRVFDSSGPEGKVRGTPQQIIEKYQLLARDAQLSHDRVAAENFLQHAEHYTRLLAEAQREMAAEQEARQQQYQNQQAERRNTRVAEPNESSAPSERPHLITSLTEVRQPGLNADVSGMDVAETAPPSEPQTSSFPDHVSEPLAARPPRRNIPRRAYKKREPQGDAQGNEPSASGPESTSPAAVQTRTPPAVAVVSNIESDASDTGRVSSQIEGSAPSKPKRPRRPREASAAVKSHETPDTAE